jgi:rhamnogalacturonyl hydrolase YesR
MDCQYTTRSCSAGVPACTTGLRLAAALLLVATAAPAAWIADLEVTSRVDFAVADYPVTVDLADLAVDPESATVDQLTLWWNDGAGVIPLAAQVIDDDGDGRPDSLFFVAPFAPGATRRFSVRADPLTARARLHPARVHAEIARKSGGAWDASRYQGGSFVNVGTLQPPPQCTDHSEYLRYEGPGWESDKVGYRLYLDHRNAIDIFGKRTPLPVLSQVGQDGYAAYHEMAEWGMDILKVAQAVGLGGYGIVNRGAMQRVAAVDTRRVDIVAAGPLLASLQIHYTGWRIGDQSRDLRATLSIHAGSRLTRAVLDIEPRARLSAGIVRLPEGELLHGPVVPEKDFTWLATHGPQSIIGDGLGMAVLYRPRDLARLEQDDHNHILTLQTRGGRAEYWFGAWWEQETGRAVPPDRAAFLAELGQAAQLLNRPPVVRVRSAADTREKTFPLDAAAVRRWTTRLADTALARRGDSLAYGQFDPESNAPARWRYTTGVLALACARLAEATGDRRYLDWARVTIGSYITADGTIHTYSQDEYNIDNLQPGAVLLLLAGATGDPRFALAADHLRAQLRTHPRAAHGGFWHKQVYPAQMWLDGLYMAAPFYAAHAAANGEREALADVARQFSLAEQLTLDPHSGLLRHAHDADRAQPWADPDSGRSPHAWGRALGWYAMALVDTLPSLPPASAEHATLRAILERVARMIADSQDTASGLWWQVLDRPGGTGNYLEASASAMFSYALARAVNEGWLPVEPYAAVALAGFTGLVRDCLRIDAAGAVRLDRICEVAGLGAGRDGSFAYYLSEPVVKDDAKGTGPCILAGIEVERLLQQTTAGKQLHHDRDGHAPNATP